MIYLLIAILLLVTYLVWVVDNHGILPSWSDSFFTIKDKWRFQVVLISLGLGVGLFGWFHAHSWLLPIAGLGLITVGLFPNFKEKTQGIIHTAGALTGAAFGLLSIWKDFGHGWIALAAFVLILAIKLRKVKNVTWWAESVAFLAIIVGILIGRKNKDND